MARRKLENALLAGKAIETGTEAADFFQVVKECQRVTYEEFRDGVFSLQYSPDAKFLAVGFGDGGIQVINAGTGKLEHELRRHVRNGLPAKCMRWHPKQNELLFTGGADGKIRIGNVKTGSCLDSVSEPGNEIYTMDFSSEGKIFATAGRDSDIRVYDAKSNQMVRLFEGYRVNNIEQNELAHSQRVFSVRFHPEHEHVLLSGGWDDHVKVWDLRTSEGVIRTIHGPHICGDGLDIKGPYVLTASWSQTNALQIWDFSDGRLLYEVPFDSNGAGDFLYTAQFCDKGMALAGGSGTNSVRALNLRTQQVLGEVSLNKPVHVLDSIHGGRKFAVGGGGTELILAQMC